MNLQLNQLTALKFKAEIWLKTTALGVLMSFSLGLSAQCDFTISSLNTQLSCINAAEDVVFTNASAGLTVVGNNLTKISSTGWNTGAVSTASVSNYGYVSTVINETNTYRMIGLNNNSTTNSYSDIDFAIYLLSNGNVYVYENGSNKGSYGVYASGDTAKVAIEDGVVTYYINSSVIYTSLIAPTLPLKVDLSIHTIGGTLENVIISNGTDGTFTSSVANAGTSPTYQWKLNGSNVGSNSSTYTNALVVDGDVITCELTLGTGGCSTGTITSNEIAVNMVSVSDLSSVSVSTTPTTSKCEKAHTVARFTSVSSNVITSGNNLTKNGSGSWNGGAISIQTIDDNGYVSTIINETNTYRMFGLNNNNTTSSYTDIDFAFYLQGNGTVSIYENGSNKGSYGSYSTGDTAKVVAEDGNIYYYLNSNLIYTSSNTPTFPLFVDVSFNTNGGTFDDIMLVSGTAGAFTADVVNGGASPTYQWKLNGANVGSNSSTYSNGSLAVNDVVTCEVTPDAAGCTVAAISSNTITYQMADPAANSSVSVSTTPTTSKCEKAHTVARFTSVSSNVITSGNNLTKNGSGSWNGGAISIQTIDDNGYVSTIINETNTYRMFGLNNNNTTSSYTDIDFAFYLQGNGTVSIYENGSNKGSYGSYSTGDTAKVVAEDGNIYYYLNSNLLYTSGNTPTFPLFVDVSFNTNGGTFDDIMLVSGTAGAFTADVVNGGTSPVYQWKLNGANVGSNSVAYSNGSLAVNDVVTCEVTPDAAGCTVAAISSNTITYQMADPAANSSVSVSTTPTTSKCEKAHTVARFTSVSSNVITSGNNLTKNGSGNWNGGAISVQTIDDNGYVSTIINETNTYRMFGLNNNNTTSSYTDIDFAFYFQANGTVSVYENGSNKGSYGSYSTGDTAKVVAEDGNIYYYLNSNLLYTSGNTPTFPLFVDVSFNTNGGTFDDIMLVSGTAGAFTADVVNGGASPIYQWKLNGANVGSNSVAYSNGSLAVNDVVTCEVTPDAIGCTVATISSNTITYQMADPAANSSVSVSTTPTTSKCEKAHTVARFTSVSSNVIASGNNLTKNGSGNWNGGAISVQTIDDNGYVSTIINETNTYRMFGLNNNNTTSSYTDIDFAFYFQANGTVSVYENGSNKGSYGSYSTGDTAKVVAEDGNIYYYLNSNLLYTSGNTPTFPLFVDVSFNTNGGTFDDIMLVSGTAGAFTADVVNGGTSPVYQWKLNGSNVGSNSSTYSNGSLAVNDVVTCEVTPDAAGCTVATISSNTITYQMADPAANSSVSVSTTPTTSKCEKAHTVARFTSVSSNVIASGNNLTKNGSGNWNGGAISVQTIDDNGYVSTIINETNKNRMFGLNNNNTTSSYTDIDFAFFLRSNGTVSIYENGSNKGSYGSYATGDTAKVVAEDGNIYYYLNSNLLYTSGNTPTFPLFVDVSFNTNGGTFDDIMLVSGTAGAFTADVVNGGTSPIYQWKLNGTNVGSNSAAYSNGSLAVNDVVTCEVTPDAAGCTVAAISSNTITYQMADPAANSSVSVSTTPTTSKCQKAHTIARFTSVSSNVIASGNNLTKNGSGSWNGGAVSIQTINDNGSAYTVINETNTYRMFGLNNNNTTSSYTDIDFAFYLQGNGNVSVYENGSNKGSVGSYSIGDTAKVVAEDGVMYYYLNSTLIYTSVNTPTFPMFVDVSFNTNGGTLNDIMLISGTDGDFTADVVNGGASPTYQWKLNGSNVGSNSSTYSNASLAVSDVVSCEVTPYATGCTVTSISSNTITIGEKNCIIWDGTAYTGGSGPAGAPSNTDVSKTLYLLGSGATLPVDAHVLNVVSTSAGALTISSGRALTVTEDINNDGTVTVDAGGSLVQLHAGVAAVTGTGTFNVKQTGQNSNLAYNIWSSPIQNANIMSVFTGVNACDVYAINASTQEWKYDFSTGINYTCNGNVIQFNASHVITDQAADGVMNDARGYFVPGVASGARTYTGTVNDGDITIPIYGNGIIGTPAVDWVLADQNLVGNPYPGGLNLSALWTANSANLQGGVHFYDHGTTSYVTWTLGGSTGPDFVAAAQGFWVEADASAFTTGTPKNLMFNNAMRSTSVDAFYKQEGNVNHNIGLSILSPSNLSARMLVGYNNNATDDKDKGYDARVFGANPALQFASILDGQDYVVQSIAPLSFGGQKVLPLTIFTGETGTHLIKEFKRENLDMDVFFRDNQTGLVHNLNDGDVSLNLVANEDYTGRFDIVFVHSVDSDNDSNTDKDTSGSVTSVDDVQESNFVLLSHATGYTLMNSNGIKGNVQVLDVTGKVVWSQNNVNSNQVEIDLSGVSSGLYFINITNEGERVYTNKVVKN